MVNKGTSPERQQTDGKIRGGERPACSRACASEWHARAISSWWNQGAGSGLGVIHWVFG